MSRSNEQRRTRRVDSSADGVALNLMCVWTSACEDCGGKERPHLELGDALRAAEVEDVALWQRGLVLRQRVPLAEVTRWFRVCTN